jgi:3-oxoadipate enol-lactonase
MAGVDDRSVEIDGAHIGYDVTGPGDAPALLFINSIGATRALWDRQVARLRDDYRVIRYDARGHGRSSAPEGDYTLAQLGRDAVAVLDAAGAPTAHVCGISLGGLTALWLGLHAPTRVRSLVLANTAARIGTLETWTDRIALVHKRGMPAVADRAMATWFTPAFHTREPETVAAFRAMVTACSATGYLGCCAALRDADLRDDVSRLRVPVLTIAGTRDVATPPAGVEFIRDHVPGSTHVAFDVAHLSNVEEADGFNGALTSFLSGVRAT